MGPHEKHVRELAKAYGATIETLDNPFTIYVDVPIGMVWPDGPHGYVVGDAGIHGLSEPRETYWREIRERLVDNAPISCTDVECDVCYYQLV